MRRRYGIAVSAALLAAQLGGMVQAQEPSLEQLQVISELLDSNDVRGLRRFLAANPELMEGNSDLAQLLSQYMQESADLFAFLGIDRWEDDSSDTAASIPADEDAGQAPPDVPEPDDAASIY